MHHEKKNTRTTVLYEFHVINFKNFTATYFKHKRNCFSYATPVLQKTVTNYILQLPAQICAKPLSSCVKLLTYSLQFTGSIIIIIIIIFINELTIQFTC